METPGSEPILTVAVLGSETAPAAVLANRLARLARHRYGPQSVLQVHPAIYQEEDHWFLTRWALFSLPTRLLSLVVLQRHDNNLHELAWSLNQTDAVLLVVNARDPGRLRDLLVLGAYRGIHRLAVFLHTRGVSDPDEIDRAERDLRLAMLLAGYPGDDVPVVRGDAVRCGVKDDWGPIEEVFGTIERHCPTPRRETIGPARFIVRSWVSAGSDYYLRSGRGRIESGQLECGETYTAHCHHSAWPLEVRAITRFGSNLLQAGAGQNVAVEINPEGAPTSFSLTEGTVVAPLGSVVLRSAFLAKLTLFTPEDGGRDRYVSNGYSPTFLLPAVQRRASVELLDRIRAKPGDTVTIRASFRNQQPELVEPGDAFVCRDKGRLIGYGVVEGPAP